MVGLLGGTARAVPITMLLAGTLAIGTLALATPASAQRGPAQVRVDAVISEPLSQTAPVLGRVVSTQSGPVTAVVQGPVEAVHVQVGDRVEKDELIAVITDTWIRLNKDQQTAALAEAEARLDAARADLGLARQELSRLRKLRRSAAFSQARYEDATQEVRRTQGEVGRAAADIERARADLSLAKVGLNRTRIRAPYPGVVTQRNTEAGAYLRPGDSVIQLVNDGDLEVEADVPFDQIRGLLPGTVVAIALADGTSHSARVRAVVPEENPLTRTRAVRFTPAFGETLDTLAVNQSVTVSVPIGERVDVVSVHKDGIVRQGGGAIVFVAEDSKAQRRAVVLGRAVGNRLEVLQGLVPGDLVVVRGNERLRPGADIAFEGPPAPDGAGQASKPGAQEKATTGASGG